MVNVSNISPNNQALRSGNTGSIFLQLVSHHCCIASWNPLLRVLPRLKVKSDHRSKFSNLSNWKEEAWKNQGFNGIRTRDLRDTDAMLYQLSYEATHGSSYVSLPMCGFIAQLVEHRTGIAEVTGSNPVEALIFSGFFFPIA